MAPRLPFDYALPLVARKPFERDGSMVQVGDRVVARDRMDAAVLWQTLHVDCVRPDAPAVLEQPAPVPVAAAPPPAAKPSKAERRRAAAGA